MNAQQRIFLLLFNFIIGFVYSQDKNIDNKTSADTSFVNLRELSKDFVYDLKYASNDNFLKQKVYDCSECYLRKNTAEALIKANKLFLRKGYRIKFFDCYRPLDVQKKMWAIVSDPNYVANPARGSIHNRGGAVDITLVDKNNKEVDMGTPFDFFGDKSSHSFKELDKKVLKNRELLKEIMLKSGFESLDSEWWHYTLIGAKKFSLSNFKWKCN
ncbi:MAG: D-alanyl-D-alanine dipeptidase [Limnohabitans sp.]|nr:D-alanyl-D-alanine dipeptidase [Limnohabitans sp.]